VYLTRRYLRRLNPSSLTLTPTWKTIDMAQSTTDDSGETSGIKKPQLSIWELAWPAILSNLLFAIIGIVSIKMIGSLGASAVASVTTGHRIFFALQAILMAVSAGTTALVARSWGAQDYEEAAKITTASLWIGNAVAIALTIPCYFFAETIASVPSQRERPPQVWAHLGDGSMCGFVAFTRPRMSQAVLR